MKHTVLMIAALLFLGWTEAFASDYYSVKTENGYTKCEADIPMRDGVTLHTVIYQPVDCGEGRPIVLKRTPYSAKPYGAEFRSSELFEGEMAVFTKHNYIVVFQDVRGCYMSGGHFVNIRPVDDEISDVTDAYDTIDWLVANTNNNGRVGVLGISYPGYYSTLAALCGHPALKAVSPQAPIGDWFIGDDVHHNGAYMLMDIDLWGSRMFLDREAVAANPYSPEVVYDEDAYEYYNRLHTTNKIIHAYGNDSLLRVYYPFWADVIDHPNYDEYWKTHTPLPFIKDIKPAMLVVAGTFDAEDGYGAVKTYEMLLKNSPATETYFINGPWTHGAWMRKEYNSLGSHIWGDGLAEYFFEKVEYPFFAHYLEDTEDIPSKVTLIPSFNDNGSAWTPLSMDRLPAYKQVPYVFKKDGKRSSSYISDPANPQRYLDPEVSAVNIRDRRYMAENYSDDSVGFVTFDFKAEKDTVFLCGPIDVKLRYRTTAEDLDFIVKVIDVAPDGSELLIRGDVFRARYAHSYEHPQFLRPGRREKLDFTLFDVVHYVLPGHSIRVQIQSSWFPLIDLNPQTAVPNIFLAEESDYKSAEVTILHNFWSRSRVLLPVVTP